MLSKHFMGDLSYLCSVVRECALSSPKMVPDLTNLSLMEEIDMKQSSRNEPQIINTVHINAQRRCSWAYSGY